MISRIRLLTVLGLALGLLALSLGCGVKSRPLPPQTQLLAR
jgi:hypothetical protein